MNYKEIKELVTLMNENNLDELEIEKEGMRVKLKRRGQAVETVFANNSVQPQQVVVSSQPENLAKNAAQEAKKNLVEIKSPMVGTFYRAPGPEAPPFVELNQKLNKGDVVCIIEAMKLMNEIKSEIEGKIVEILVENGRPVEFGQVIFLVDPLAK